MREIETSIPWELNLKRYGMATRQDCAVQLRLASHSQRYFEVKETDLQAGPKIKPN